MIWRLALLLISFLVVGWAALVATRSASQQRIGPPGKSGRWPRRSQVMLYAALFIGVFAAAGLQDQSIGWWALPSFFIPFWLAASLPIRRHNRSVARSVQAAPDGDTPDDVLPAGR